MHPALGVRRGVLIKSYRLYLDADRNWTIAVKGARRWFPASDRPGNLFVGDPHLKIRKFYEVRERALNRLLLAREKLENARLRLARRQRQDRVTPRDLSAEQLKIWARASFVSDTGSSRSANGNHEVIRK